MPSTIPLFVLNFNGRRLLEECLPSIVRAAAACRHAVEVWLLDNGSTDTSRSFVQREFPNVRQIVCENRGLCSFNEVLRIQRPRHAILLNNDVKLREDCLDPLLAPLLDEPRPDGSCWMTAPRAVLFDGRTYEGFRTAVGWRWGLVSATAHFPGNAGGRLASGRTASVGAAMAVDVERFLQLGGFDSLYLPGRLEDLDLAYRAYLRGWHIEYVPQSVVAHQGQASFTREFGADACLHLAWRNTLLWQWKNLRRPWHRLKTKLGVGARLLAEVLQVPRRTRAERWVFWRTYWAARRRWKEAGVRPLRPADSLRREREFFREFSPSALAAGASSAAPSRMESSIAELRAIEIAA